MKAAVLLDVGDLRIVDREVPKAGSGEAVIKLKYAGLCGSDITVYKGEHPTATLPVVPGHEMVGVIHSINAPDSSLVVGDRVVVNPLISCGMCEACVKGHQHVCKNLKLLGIHEDGGFAEFVKVSVDKLINVPDTITDLEAALAEPFAVGYHVNYRSGVRVGDTVLVIGAGTIGLVIGLIAREAGARVFVSEVNQNRLLLVKKLGFETIDAENTDVLNEILRITDNNGVDIVYEASGSASGIRLMTDACKIRGTIVSMSLSAKPVLFQLGMVSFKELTFVGSRVYEHYHFLRAVNVLEKLTKKYDLSLLSTETYSLDEVNTAIEDMLAGRNTGKILIRY